MSEDANKRRRARAKAEEEEKIKEEFVVKLRSASQVLYEQNTYLARYLEHLRQIDTNYLHVRNESSQSSENQPGTSQQMIKNDENSSKEKSMNESQKKL